MVIGSEQFIEGSLVKGKLMKNGLVQEPRVMRRFLFALVNIILIS